MLLLPLLELGFSYLGPFYGGLVAGVRALRPIHSTALSLGRVLAHGPITAVATPLSQELLSLANRHDRPWAGRLDRRGPRRRRQGREGACG